jgi:plasmid stabilization system protein ParE
VHRETLIELHELEEAERELPSIVEDVRAHVLKGNVEAALACLDDLRSSADGLEQALLDTHDRSLAGRRSAVGGPRRAWCSSRHHF